ILTDLTLPRGRIENREISADSLPPPSSLRRPSHEPSFNTEADRSLSYTWSSFERLTQPSGLPADSLPRDGVGWGNPSRLTTPTDIAAYLWSVLAAERLKLIGTQECRSRLQRTLSTLASME